MKNQKNLFLIAELAVTSRKERSYDCCQAVFVTYHDLLSLPRKQAENIGHAYGSNVGINGFFDTYDDLHFIRYLITGVNYNVADMFENCGPLCGALLCACVKENPVVGKVPRDMMHFCPLAAEMDQLFVDTFGSALCAKILKSRIDNPHGVPCDDLVRFCCKMVEDMVFPGVFEPFTLNLDIQNQEKLSDTL